MCIVLYCFVLFCIVLYCIVLFCIALYVYCIVLYCFVLYCIVLCCIVLKSETIELSHNLRQWGRLKNCILLHCLSQAALHCIVMYCTVLYCIVLYISFVCLVTARRGFFPPESPFLIFEKLCSPVGVPAGASVPQKVHFLNFGCIVISEK